jgi:cytoskeletal protein RodZ
MSESLQDLSNTKKDDSVVKSELSDNAFPGRILRAAREELNYSLEQVAQELHLRPSVVQAMEDENYDDFSSDVFLKGYFRSYCRLVNLHESRMVELLESQLKGLKKDIDDAAYLIKKEKQVKKRKKALVGFILVGVVVSILLFLISLFYPRVDAEVLAESSTASAPNTAEMTSAAEPQKEIEKESAADDLSLKTTEISAEGTKSIVEIAKRSPEKNQTTEVTRTNERIQIDEVQEAINTTQPKIDTPLVTEDSKVINAIFEASFSGDCWFKLIDGNQKTVFAALKRNGDRISYSGVTPFKIVLGDASKVSLTLDGESVNLKSHTAKNGRAQLTLNKG